MDHELINRRRRDHGEAIRERRESLGMTQAELATKAGLLTEDIVAIETGARGSPPQRTPPNLDATERLYGALGWTREQYEAAFKRPADTNNPPSP